MNLANLSAEAKNAMELQKQVCLARSKCKGKSRFEQNKIIAAFPENVQREIERLRGKK